MAEHLVYEPQDPDLVEHHDGIQQMVFFPTPEIPGRCITITDMDRPTSADLFDQTCNTPTGVGPLLNAAGVSISYGTIWDTKRTTFSFVHPEVLNGNLKAMSTAHPDFRPPRFVAHPEGRYAFSDLARYLGEHVMPLATTSYATVHDYETHVPALTAMCPELFTALCEQAQDLQLHDRGTWLQQFDSLSQLGMFGNILASTSPSNLREHMTNWLEAHTSFSSIDAIRLAYHSENYRREVITPVVNSFRT